MLKYNSYLRKIKIGHTWCEQNKTNKDLMLLHLKSVKIF